MENFNPKQIERPENATLKKLLGALLLIACAFSFWSAYWNYGRYQSEIYRLNRLRENPVSTSSSLTPEREIAISKFQANSFLTFSILSGAGGFAFLGIALFLFIRARKINGQSELKYKKTTDPSAAIFFGSFFLIPSVPIAVWAYWCFTGQAYSSGTNRGIIEGTICIIVSLIFFANALKLFIKAFQARNTKPIYEPIKSLEFPLPERPIEVRQKRIYDVLFVLIAGFFILITLLISVQTLTGEFEQTRSKIIKLILFPGFTFLLLFVLGYLMLRAKRRAIQLLDASGITRGDNKQFAWNEFCGTITLKHFNQRIQRKYVWRVELAFSGGETAWIIPNRIKNYDEVFNYLSKLPTAHLKNQ